MPCALKQPLNLCARNASAKSFVTESFSVSMSILEKSLCWYQHPAILPWEWEKPMKTEKRTAYVFGSKIKEVIPLRLSEIASPYAAATYGRGM